MDGIATFSDPTTNIKKLVLGEGSTVVDLGSGTGFYSIAAAQEVGPDGRVYAVDVQKDLLENLKQKAADQHLSNIDVIWADIEKQNGSKIADGKAETVLICNTLFQLEDKDAAIAEAARLLRPSGRLCVIDWTDSHAGLGPNPDMVVTSAEAKDLVSKHLEFDREFGAGEHHYGLVFRKK